MGNFQIPASNDETPDPARQKLLAQCRRDRRRTLAAWDAAVFSVIEDYETNTLAIRAQIKQLSAETRGRVTQRSQPIKDAADAERYEPLRLYDESKDRPAEARERDLQSLDDAWQPLVHVRDQVDAWLRKRSIPPPEIDAPSAEACQIAGERSPDSLKMAVATLRSLTKRYTDLYELRCGGLASGLVDHYALPILGVVLMAVAAAAMRAEGVSSRWLIGLVSLALLLAFISAHVATAVWLRRTAERVAPRANSLRNAAAHCYQRGREISASIHRREARELAKRRDRKLAEIDRRQQQQIDRIRDEEAEWLKRELTERERQLRRLDDDFHAAIEEVESRMRAEANRLAQDIQRRLNTEPAG